jgi:Copper amine oxidase N-terminal domain.
MLRKSLYFIMIAVLLFALLPVNAFAQSYYFTDTPGNVNSPLNHLTDYLKAPGDSVTVVIDDAQDKTTYYYSFVSKGTDSNGDYIIVDEKIVHTYDTITDQRKFYIPYIPHKIGTITYTKKNVGQVTEDMFSVKYVTDDVQVLGYLQGLYTDVNVISIDKVNGVPIRQTQYWYFANFLPQSEREYLASRFIDGTAYEWPSIFYTINVNGKNIHPEQLGAMPYIKDGNTMIPYRALFELGFGLQEDQVVWNAQDQTVTVTRGNTVIKLQIGSTTAYINGKPYTMNTAPVIELDRTYVPLRFVSEGLGYKVNWTPDPGERAGWGTVDINDN